MVEREEDDAHPILRDLLLPTGDFAYDPVWILYLPCCKLLKGHSLLTFYKLTVLFSVGGGKIFCFLWLFRSFS